MRALQAIGGDALPAFQDVLDFAEVNGLLVETHPLLRRLWRAYTTLPAAEWNELDAHLHGLLPEGPWRPEWPTPAMTLGRWLAEDLAALPPGHRPPPCDPYWSCKTFDAVQQAASTPADSPGVLFTVLYEPSTSTDTFAALAAAAGQVSWRVRLAARPTATAQLGPRGTHRPIQGGVSLGPSGTNIKGTLGGILNLNGDSYAVTCGHVIDPGIDAVQPCEPDGGTGMAIGSCTHSTAATLAHKGQRCQARGFANTVDAALVKVSGVTALDTVRDLGTVVRTAPLADIAEDETVRVSARSGTRTLVTGALTLRRSIAIGNGHSTDVYCFQDLFELRRPGNRWGATGSVKPPTRGGDSGAWVLRDEPGGWAWLGMVTAGDGPSSYAQFAENLESWADGQVP